MSATDKCRIRRCPICGGKVEFRFSENDGKKYVKCMCSKCFLTPLGLWLDSEDAAVAVWNEAVEEMLARR